MIFDSQLELMQLMPLHTKTPSSLASYKSRLVIPFWYQITQVVLEKNWSYFLYLLHKEESKIKLDKIKVKTLPSNSIVNIYHFLCV